MTNNRTDGQGKLISKFITDDTIQIDFDSKRLTSLTVYNGQPSISIWYMDLDDINNLINTLQLKKAELEAIKVNDGGEAGGQQSK